MPSSPSARAARPSRAAAEPGAVSHANEVRLLGRLAADPVRRELPSGDVLVSFRLVVEREQGGRAAPTRRSSPSPTVDTLDCAAWSKGVQAVLARATPGDLLEVQGALRRRFWRTVSGAASRSEVEAARVRRVGRGVSA